MIKDNFDLEHSIIENNLGQLEVLELPLSKKVFNILNVSAVIFAGIFLSRVLFLSYWNGDFYKNRSLMNVEQTITLPAVRGSIYDRFGALLATSVPSHRIVLNTGLVRREKLNLDSALEYLSKIIGAEKSELESLIEKSNLEKSALITLARNISLDQAEAIKEFGNSALEVQEDYQREYLGGPAFAHILGYTGLLKYNDTFGKVGLENYYESVIGGQDGVRLMYKNAKGDVFDEKLLDTPKNGDDLYLTIDGDLQKYFYDSLRSALRSLGRDVGVGIALNPQNGEVLAMVSVPSYDNNVFTKNESRAERAALLQSALQPLFNRAVSGEYNPGSTIKPLVAVAALNEGVVDTKKQVFSAGFIEIPNPYFPDKPSRFLDWKAHGWVDLKSALARSSNIYFYSVGGGFGDIKGLGIEKLKEYWQKFMLGQKTGIDMTSEAVGFLPDPAEKEARKKDIWRIGDTYNVTIGQGDLLVTPIQLINYISSLANGGNFYKPYIVKIIKDKDGQIIKEREPESINNLSYLGDYINEVKDGMQDAVSKPYGTAHLLADLPFNVSAKTGSAQVSNNTKTNAFFVGYLPAEALAKVGAPIDKQIAILVLIENAREGSLNAVPIGKDVLNWYYQNRLTRQ